MENKNYICADCAQLGCVKRDMEQTPGICPCKESEIQVKARALYDEEENHQLAVAAAQVEAIGYGQWNRVREVMEYAKRMNYSRLGLVFCMGLKKEANIVAKIFRDNGFEVSSIGCKNGSIPKSEIGLTEADCLGGNTQGPMCNPIGQALLMNETGVQFNVLLGLCVGHDTLALKYLEAPCTILTVKDRATGHNPMAAIYCAEGYFKNKMKLDK